MPTTSRPTVGVWGSGFGIVMTFQPLFGVLTALKGVHADKAFATGDVSRH